MDRARWLRSAIRRRGLLLCVAAISSGCAALVPTPVPGPTLLDPPAGTPVEVAVDNRSGERIAMTVSQGGQLGPSMVVGACEAGNFVYPIEGPFTVGVGNAADLAERPMPPLVESSRLDKIDGEYRLLIRVAADGTVTFGRLEGPAPLRAAGC